MIPDLNGNPLSSVDEFVNMKGNDTWLKRDQLYKRKQYLG